jgi:hypothetical protein
MPVLRPPLARYLALDAATALSAAPEKMKPANHGLCAAVASASPKALTVLVCLIKREDGKSPKSLTRKVFSSVCHTAIIASCQPSYKAKQAHGSILEVGNDLALSQKGKRPIIRKRLSSGKSFVNSPPKPNVSRVRRKTRRDSGAIPAPYVILKPLPRSVLHEVADCQIRLQRTELILKDDAGRLVC